MTYVLFGLHILLRVSVITSFTSDTLIQLLNTLCSVKAYVFIHAVSGRLSSVLQVNATNMEYCSWDICTLSYFTQVSCLIPDPKPDILSFWSFPLFLYTTFGMDSSHLTYFQIQCSNQSLYNVCSWEGIVNLLRQLSRLLPSDPWKLSHTIIQPLKTYRVVTQTLQM
jgi:hypothetical protein